MNKGPWVTPTKEKATSISLEGAIIVMYKHITLESESDKNCRAWYVYPLRLKRPLEISKSLTLPWIISGCEDVNKKKLRQHYCFLVITVHTDGLIHMFYVRNYVSLWASSFQLNSLSCQSQYLRHWLEMQRSEIKYEIICR